MITDEATATCDNIIGLDLRGSHDGSLHTALLVPLNGHELDCPGEARLEVGRAHPMPMAAPWRRPRTAPSAATRTRSSTSSTTTYVWLDRSNSHRAVAAERLGLDDVMIAIKRKRAAPP